MTGKDNARQIDTFIATKLDTYFDQLQGKKPCKVYAMVIEQAEAAVIRCVMHHCNNNQSQAASILGISRGSLRNKIQKYTVKA